jgi:two-component system sensor histidine kinase HydH
LQLLATQAAIAIENARLFTAEQERGWQMETIRRVTEEITRELDLPTLLSLITRRVAELVWAGSGTVWLWEEAEQALVASAWHGLGEWMQSRRLRLGEGVAGAAAERRAGVIVNDYPTSPYAVRDVLDHSTIVAVLAEPLLYRERLLGVITVDVYDPGRRFSESDRRTLALLANQAATAIENARLFRESQRLAQENVLRLRRISILHEIGMAVQGTMHLDALLQIILTGTTFGEGLGFNRALLLLLNPARNRLEGRMGVGPASGEEAARVWNALALEPRSLREVISERAARRAEEAESDFDRMARSLTIPLRPDAGILALTALEARPFHITDARHDPRVRPEYGGRFQADEFATVPLVAKGKVVGVMAVDNMFSGKAITAQDLEFLSIFASQAGLAVESAQVYTRLEEASREIQRSHHQLLHQERLATLGEMAAHVVHEIRNPLVSIGGFARRLAQRLAGREPEGQYAQIIAREVDRLERIVHDVRVLSREVRLSLAEVDLHELVQDCLVLFAERIATQGIRLRMDLTGRPPVLLLDMVRMKQAILNLLTNALEAMPNGGTLSVVTRILREENGQLVDSSIGQTGMTVEGGGSRNSASRSVEESTNRPGPNEWVEVSMGDTGGGISPEILGAIFEPFFTTKSAGTGLGLTLVRRIVHAHGGRIAVDNSPGTAVTFQLFLPAGGIPSEGAASA